MLLTEFCTLSHRFVFCMKRWMISSKKNDLPDAVFIYDTTAN